MTQPKAEKIANTPRPESSNYSLRKAAIGSARVARRAGIQHASNDTPASSSETAANVIGSVALTPKSSPWRSRVTAIAAARPITNPAEISLTRS